MRALQLARPYQGKVAALTLLSQSDTELSLQQHLDLAPDLLQYNRLAADSDPDEPLTMAAQPVPHPSTDRKRVKVYELRNNDWFDRGTGFCTAAFTIVSASKRQELIHDPVRAITNPSPQSEDGQQRDPRVLVESEDQPDRVLLETRICKEDGFHKQQGMFSV